MVNRVYINYYLNDPNPLRRVIAYLMAGILISYGYNPNPLRRGYNRIIYIKIIDTNVDS